MEELRTNILEKLKSEDEHVFGDLQIKKNSNVYFVTGTIYTTLDDARGLVQSVFAEQLPEAVVYVALRTKSTGLSVHVSDEESTESSWSNARDSVLDEVQVLYQGMLDRSLVTAHPAYKYVNHETLTKVKNVVAVTGMVAPLILDRNFQVIDGNLRLEVAEILEYDEIPVMILNCDGVKADAVRLFMNRSSEFQRWNYDEVDAFVDTVPQLQPLLEPLGFFSTNILPVTFFGNTVLQYEIDEYNQQMSQYTQDVGLVEWAKMRREEILAEEERKKERKNAKPSVEGRVSLFDLEPTEEDFVEVVDAHQVVSDHVDHMMEVADGITDAYDKVRRKEKEKKGQAWQTSRRTSKKLAADKRAEAEAAAQVAVDDEVVVPDDENE